MATLYGSFARIDLADGVLVAMADDATVRVCAAPSPDVERLTADVARLEREAVDLTHGRDVAHRAILAAAARRQQLISDLAVAERRCSTLTAEADACARELADLRAAVVAAAEGVAPDVSRYGHHVGVALGRTAQLHREAAHRATGGAR